MPSRALACPNRRRQWIVQVPVSNGAAEVSVTVPEWFTPGPHLMTLRAKPSGTLVSLPFTVVEP